jgi:hypothetical protein
MSLGHDSARIMTWIASYITYESKAQGDTPMAWVRRAKVLHPKWTTAAGEIDTPLIQLHPRFLTRFSRSLEGFMHLPSCPLHSFVTIRWIQLRVHIQFPSQPPNFYALAFAFHPPFFFCT